MNLPLNLQPIIGIDPDIDKCGVATYNPSDNSIQLCCMTAVDLLHHLLKLHQETGVLKVYIEASHKIEHNWHLSKDKPAVAARKGYSVGRCHQVGITLCDYCRKWAIPFEEVLPLTKIWSGSDRKCTHDNLLHALSPRNVSLDQYHQKRSNQEERDAALLIIGHIRVYDQLNKQPSKPICL